MTAFDDRIARLPKWAQSYICGLERRIDEVDPCDLRPGAVNSIVLTRREVQMAKKVQRVSIDAETWRLANRGTPR